MVVVGRVAVVVAVVVIMAGAEDLGLVAVEAVVPVEVVSMERSEGDS